jgi:hypothetical protein
VHGGPGVKDGGEDRKGEERKKFVLGFEGETLLEGNRGGTLGE